ncbi:methionine ABC transporter ATP-binding protein [Enterococcus dispar]|uniref:ABC transporter ATP-binding protein n=1 Tax=Enterococcus dispar ATCC 51266 TaxID=1139219 RepID=S0KIK9_9ENTE|nr:ATP-binding cassette domain-containing protein [Enterococcus dispar]EOT40775.1 ABC transporter ATP-binding protein [Enterococcus dispar ATCC 51266]EOW86852.1 ABC transporter ATP-binding protein [Enterococcus dispar ATCC 51266]MCU7357773.1 ATP-binding cassette domain-containing protein [Enterococcus dispar]MDT2706220.1 ATP-binding cassette domain-containing protein [Enterococcus dispar]OJG39797.1 ABC transporter ATP-binding protein [Enterococcus dispar]
MALIQLTDVKKSFDVKKQTIHAVDGVSLTVDKGDIYGIVGYSGAGKSTLVRLLNGLELATSGSVIVDGQNIGILKNKELRDFRKNVGMIFQHFNLLWSRTVLENIELPMELAGISKQKRQQKAQELLALVNLEGRGDAYPAQLSGGQKQRVGIARALANDPKILLCDEATSALDPQTTDEVLELLLDINQKLNLTIVLITHEMNVIRKICNKVAVMEAGKIVEEGQVSEVFRNPQQAVTKRFVQQDLKPSEDPKEVLQEFIAENPNGVLATLVFKADNANEPVISQAIRQFDVDINVVYGNIRQSKEDSFGSLTVLITGKEDAIDQTMAFFSAQQVGVEVLHRG